MDVATEGACMALVFSYRIMNARPVDHNRIQSFFERLHWEKVDQMTYRYPRQSGSRKVSKTPPSELWMRQTIPALMLFLAYAEKRDLHVSKCILEGDASTGIVSEQPRKSSKRMSEMPLAKTECRSFGEKVLRQWLDSVSGAVVY